MQPDVPVKTGAEAVADLMPVATVTSVPALGSVPAEKLPAVQPNVRVSPLTVAVISGSVQLGSVPALPKGLTLAVFTDTVTVGADTVPAGV